MNNLTVSITPTFKDIGTAFNKIDIASKLQKAVVMFSEAIRDESVKETPVDTGRLRASIMTSIGALQATIAPHTVYAEWIHEGKMKRNGQSIFIKGGGRAGTPAGGKPFMAIGSDRVVQNKEKFIDQTILADIKAAFQGVSK